MNTKYIYIDKKGKKIYSDKKIDDKDLKLVREFRDGKLKSEKVVKK
jgi:hypothetical protein